MLSDIEGKLKSCDADNSALVIFSANDRGCMHEQLRWFEEHVFSGVPQPLRESYCFPASSPWTPTDSEFWIAVWPVKSGPLFSQ